MSGNPRVLRKDSRHKIQIDYLLDAERHNRYGEEKASERGQFVHRFKTSFPERAEHIILIFLAGVAVKAPRLRVRPDGPIRVAVFPEDLESPAAGIRKAPAILVHDGELAATPFRRNAIFRLNLQKVVDDDGAVRISPRLESFHRLVVGVNVMQSAGGLVIGAFRAGQTAPEMRPAPIAVGIRDLFGVNGFKRSSPTKRNDGCE